MSRLFALSFILGCFAFGVILLASTASRAEPLKAVVFDVEPVESLMEGPSGIPAARLAAASAEVRDLLTKSGTVTVLDLTPASAEIAKNLPLHTCHDCDLDIAKKLGADIEITTAVQKTTAVIIGISGSVRDVQTGRVVRSGVVDVRGNDPAVWAHGIKFLVRDRLLDPPLPVDAGALRAAMDKTPPQ